MNEREIFLAALQRPDAAARAAFLDEACADAQVRRQMEVLLAEHDKLGSFLEAPAVDLPSPPCGEGPQVRGGATVAESVLERPGAVIGPYKLLQQIGEGGMGVVWMAEQTQPVQRKVALKVIKPGMDSRQVIARFEAERQALALMDHVNIARVFDGGTTGVGHVSNVPAGGHVENVPHSGRPYFVMELVHGVPITKYCDDNHLTPRERLELFVPVCQAIQHAHQKGIIHRDIKPSNVMVTLYDDRPVPKVIDFGVAKATEQKLTERTQFTQYGTMVGTLEYMSPEQAEMSALGVDTRSDIYSLGVLLYELLTASTPLTHKRMKLAAYAEILRMIKEEEPPKPSTRLSDSGEALASISANRHMEPAKLTKLVRGELDWIVMKTLEKDRNRRYETAKDFAADVQRYLADEPVQACPPSAAYRLRKFLRRNKGPVLAVGLILLSLVAGVAFSTWQAIRATVAEGIAKDNEAHALAAAQAEKRARQAEADERHNAEESEADRRAFAHFLAKHVLAATRPEGVQFGVGVNVTMAEALAKAEPALDQAFRGRPRAEALTRHEIGVTWQNLGRYPEAVRHLRRAVELHREVSDAADTLATMNSLAFTYQAAGWLDKALPLCQEALATGTEKLGPDHELTLISMNNLALAHQAVGRLDLAVPLFEQTVAKRAEKFGPRHLDTLNSTDNLAGAYRESGRLDKALPLYEEVRVKYRETFGPDHADTLASMNNLALAYGDAGWFDRALPLCIEALAKAKQKYGPDHHLTLICMHNLAIAYQYADQLDRALALDEEVLVKAKEKVGPDHPLTLTSMNTLASAYQAAGKLDLALPLYQQALAKRSEKLGPDHPSTLTSMNNLANGYQAAGKLDLALSLHEETFKLTKAKLGPDHPITLAGMHNLAEGYRTAKKLDLALPLCQETHKLMKAKLGPDHPSTLSSMNILALCYLDAGKRDLAVPLLQETLKLRKAKLGPDHPDTLVSMSNLATGYGHEKLDLALPLLKETLKLRKAKLPPNHPSTLRSMNNLANGYNAAGKFDLALHLYEETLVLRKARLGLDHPDTLATMNSLAGEYERARLYDKAEPLLREQADFWKQKAGLESSLYADQLAALGLSLLRQAKHAEAEPFLRQCLATRATKQPNAWTTFTTKSMLGGALLGLKKHAEAEPLLVQGYQGMKQREATIPAAGKAHLSEAAERLVQFYDATGNKDEAAKWRKTQEDLDGGGTIVGPVHEVGKGLELKGRIDKGSKALIYQVRLLAGATYVLEMLSPNPKALDPLLRLKDSSGKRLAEDDDSAGNFNARIVFRADMDGIYRIQATSYGYVGQGEFTLTVRPKE